MRDTFTAQKLTICPVVDERLVSVCRACWWYLDEGVEKQVAAVTWRVIAGAAASPDVIWSAVECRRRLAVELPRIGRLQVAGKRQARAVCAPHQTTMGVNRVATVLGEEVQEQIPPKTDDISCLIESVLTNFRIIIISPL